MPESESELSNFRPVTKQIARTFGVPIFQVEEALSQEPHASALAAFCRADGPVKMMVYMEPAHNQADDDDDDDDEPAIYVCTGDVDRFVDRGLLLVKSSDDAVLDCAQAVESEVCATVVLGSPAKSLLASIEQIFQPVLAASQPTWAGKLPEDGAGDFLAGVGKYVSQLSEAVQGVESGIELAKPSVSASTMDLKPSSLQRAATVPEIVESFEAAVLAWCGSVEELLGSLPPPPHMVPEGDEGPSTELEYWKAKLGKFTAVADQLRTHEMKAVLGVLSARQQRSPALRRWRQLDAPMTDTVRSLPSVGLT